MITDTRSGRSARALTALADPTRRAALEALARRPLAVGELAERLPVSRPAVSQHLKVLREAGLVRETRRGTRHFFSVAPEGGEALRAYIDSIWSDALSRFDDAARRLAARDEGDTPP